MRKLTVEQKIYLLKRREKLFRRKLRKKSNRGIIIKVKLIAPEVLDLSTDETMAFINKVRECSNDKKYWLKIDFTPIKRIEPSCALVFSSELDRYIKIRGKRHRLRVLDFERWDEDIKMLLRDMGMYDLLNIPNLPYGFDELPSKTDVRFLKFISNNRLDGKYALELQDLLAKLIGDVPDSKKLQIGLTEAMTNVFDHA